jgi:hypothetical protein
MTDTPDRYVHPKEILETGTPVKHTVNGAEMMWVVDFDLQIATLGPRLMYERKDWLGFAAPNRDWFLQFLKAQQSKATEGTEKSLQAWLNEGVTLVPVFDDAPHTSFYVGFYLGDVPYSIGLRKFDRKSGISDFINEIVKINGR